MHFFDKFEKYYAILIFFENNTTSALAKPSGFRWVCWGRQVPVSHGEADKWPIDHVQAYDRPHHVTLQPLDLVGMQSIMPRPIGPVGRSEADRWLLSHWLPRAPFFLLHSSSFLLSFSPTRKHSNLYTQLSQFLAHFPL